MSAVVEINNIYNKYKQWKSIHDEANEKYKEIQRETKESVRAAHLEVKNAQDKMQELAMEVESVTQDNADVQCPFKIRKRFTMGKTPKLQETKRKLEEDPELHLNDTQLQKITKYISDRKDRKTKYTLIPV
jgi:hypothetical protein